ncbi:AAA family ATPase [Niabella hibiscisoli]|nr:AAA family ATPase [Niabella hibiscisoli]
MGRKQIPGLCYFLGAPGTGKTTLANIIAQELSMSFLH